MFNLQHFAMHNVSSAILYRAIGIDLLVVRQNSYGFERSDPRQCDIQLAMCEDWLALKSRAQTSGQLTASDPIRTTHENIAIHCGELPAANCLFFVKKPKDNRTWVADQEPVNMKRLEP